MLVTTESGYYIDATYGRGGHSAAILNRLDNDGRLLAFDRDMDAVLDSQRRFDGEPRFNIEHKNYSAIADVVDEGTVDGVLFDLGVSSPQLDQPQRGFSFDRKGPLDMRMDVNSGEPLGEWLKTVDMETLAAIFKEYGDERYSRRIARAVVEQSSLGLVNDTSELASVIKRAHPRWEKHKHPATRCFQALRIYVNRELDHLQAALVATVDLLKPGARLVVISFHSLEDRVVKKFFKSAGGHRELPRGLPVRESELAVSLHTLGKAVRPSGEEVRANPRARSAIMRVAVKQ